MKALTVYMCVKVFHELHMPQFSSEDISGIFRLADPEGSGKLSWEAFKITFDIPDPLDVIDCCSISLASLFCVGAEHTDGCR